MLRHFEHEAVAVVVGLQRVLNRGQVALELNVHHGAGNLRYAAEAFGICHRVHRILSVGRIRARP
jgi:hypothetical protein